MILDSDIGVARKLLKDIIIAGGGEVVDEFSNQKKFYIISETKKEVDPKYLNKKEIKIRKGGFILDYLTLEKFNEDQYNLF
jgi:hypothetical protein